MNRQQGVSLVAATGLAVASGACHQSPFKLGDIAVEDTFFTQMESQQARALVWDRFHVKLASQYPLNCKEARTKRLVPQICP